MPGRSWTWIACVALCLVPGGAVATPAASGLPPAFASPAPTWEAPAPAGLAAVLAGDASGGLLPDAPADGADGPVASIFGRRGPREPKAPREASPTGLVGGERARILLRSLTLPGWGQATLGHRRSAALFGVAEAAVWGAFTAFRIQVAMRDDASMRVAQVQAGIDLRGRDEEWRRIVGGFSSSDEYNELVVARDAANLYLGGAAPSGRPPGEVDPYFAYYEEHKLKGDDTWRWASPEAQQRYRDLRQNAQRAAQRANAAMAAAVINRIVSALHAARTAGRTAPASHSLRLEVVPVPSSDATAFQVRVRARF